MRVKERLKRQVGSNIKLKKMQVLGERVKDAKLWILLLALSLFLLSQSSFASEIANVTSANVTRVSAQLVEDSRREEATIHSISKGRSLSPLDKDLRHKKHTKRQSTIVSGASALEADSAQPDYQALVYDHSAHDSQLTDNGQSEAENLATAAALINNNKQQATTNGKRTLYACEEKQLQIECQVGESIQLVRANYGRFSIQTCNEHGQVDWRVNCMSSESTQIIANSCQAKQSCQLLASNSIFGDPCPGTQKYLEVHYQCVPATQLTLNKTEAPQLKLSTAQRPTSKQTTVIQQATNVQLQDSGHTAATPTFGRWPPEALPPWMLEVQQQTQAPAQLAPASVPTSPGKLCPETVWRQLRWPATAAGLTVQLPCPAHAHSATSDSQPASFACLAGGVWAPRVRALNCQSTWLSNLTQRLEAGDSPLSIAGELALRTRPISAPSLSGANAGLFGRDLLQLGRVVRRLVEEMGELLNRINDDKQRLAFAREMVQSLVELVNNVAHEQQLDAWMDLETSHLSSDKQRLAGQLVQSLEGATVLLAGAQNSNQLSNAQDPAPISAQSEPFVRVSEQTYVAIRALNLNANRSIEVELPSEVSTLGTKWMNLEQTFKLHLQVNNGAAGAEQIQSQVDVKYSQAMDNSEQSGLGAQMEPISGTSEQVNVNRIIVNSNLVSLSIVADSRYKYTPLKVDLSAPIELVFKHIEPRASDWALSKRLNPRCVYWDNSISDWLSDGCKLVATNRSHSHCACNHLTTFALLTEWDEQSTSQQSLSDSINSGQNQQQQQPKVQLDSVENELILPNKLLYLAKMLDGHLFADHQLVGNGFSARLLIYVSCLISAALLALHLAAAAYNRAHARRLLDAIPKVAPAAGINPQQQQSSQSTSDASPTYSASDYTFGHKLKLPEAPEVPASKSLSLGLSTPTLVQMLALQLLLVLLVESQNCLQRANFRRVAATPLYRSWPDEAALQPIGGATWLLVMALYYLTTAITCWLMGTLIRLNLSLSSGSQAPRSSASTSSSAASDKSAHYATQSAINPSAGSMYTSARANNNNVTCFAQSQLAQLNSSTSPTSSFSSINGHSIERQAALSRLEDSTQLYGHFSGPDGPRKRLTRLLDPQALVVHALPLLATLAVAWLSSSRGHALNALTYTSSLGSQLAFWPLLVDASATYFSVLLYYGPTICLLLLLSAVFALRRRPARHAHKPASVVNPYGSSAFMEHHHQRQQQMALSKQSAPKIAFWRTDDSKRAKLLCTILLALLALHSICWISFFAHIHQALNSNQPNNNLILAFASSNLLFVLLALGSQRHTLRRAARLAGLTRLLALLRPRSDQRQQQQQQQQSVKVSPSSQSLFLVSQANGQLRPQRQLYNHPLAATPSYLYGGPPTAYSPATSSQHLYQQLGAAGSNQHFYESAMALNEQQHRLNVAQLMQQQQHNMTLNRLLSRQQYNLEPDFGQENPKLVSLEAGQKQFVQCAAKSGRAGEADGPLVAFGNPPTTFGPNLAATGHTEPRQFRMRSPADSPSSPMESQCNVINMSNCLASGADANQHQYYSINARSTMLANQCNYTDALKLAMQQQQSELSSANLTNFRSRGSSRQAEELQNQHHFQQQRNSHQSMIDRERCAASNIYDVANYAQLSQ